MTVVNVEEFRYRLTRWMINRYIAFSEVKNSEFQDILKSVNGSINDYLVRSENTIRNVLRFIDDLSTEPQFQDNFSILFERLWTQVLSGDLPERWVSSDARSRGGVEDQATLPMARDPSSPQALRNEEWLRQKDEALTKFISQLEAFQREEGPDHTFYGSKRWQDFQPILTELDDIWRNRIFFTTDPVGPKKFDDPKFSIGFALNNVRPHDQVCVLFGEPRLYILRERPRGLYEFVSDAYIDGLITGKGCENLQGRVFAIS